MSKKQKTKKEIPDESSDNFIDAVKRINKNYSAVNRKSRVVIDDRLEMVFEIGECCKELPKYTLGQILYSALRKISKRNGGNIRFLLDVTNKELMINIDNIIKEEKE